MKAAIDDGYRLLAAGYFRKQAKQLADQLDGVRESKDIEYIHRARVATRRLRAAMRLFGDWVASKQAKRWRKEIRRVTQELGDARDKDVQIEFLCGALSRVKELTHCVGIAHLMMQLEYQREVLQPKVSDAVARLQQSKVLTEMRDAGDQVLLEIGNRVGGVRTPAVTDHVALHVRGCLDDLLAHESCLEDPKDRQGHHQMRIAAKRLRYTLEISRPVFEGAVDDTIESVKRLQSLLGEAHDCDVWDDHLAGFLDEERRRMAASFGSSRPFARVEAGLSYLRRDRAEARKIAFAETVAFWCELRRQRTWERLAATAGCCGQPAVPARPAATALVIGEPALPGHGGNGKETTPRGSGRMEPSAQS